MPALSESLPPGPRRDTFSTVPVSGELFGHADVSALPFRLPSRSTILDIAGNGREPAHPRLGRQIPGNLER